MSVTIDGILYTKIGTNEACVGTEDGSQQAVSTSREGEINILSSVLISSVTCVVTMLGRDAFFHCKKITNIIIPNTVNTLKYRSLGWLYLTAPLILPSSITKVESWFLCDWYSKSLIFCGTKEPEMINTNGDTYISEYFKDNVLVPQNYEKDTFCKKTVSTSVLSNCPKIEEKIKRIFTCFRKRNIYPITSFMIHIILIS